MRTFSFVASLMLASPAMASSEATRPLTGSGTVEGTVLETTPVVADVGALLGFNIESAPLWRQHIAIVTNSTLPGFCADWRGAGGLEEDPITQSEYDGSAFWSFKILSSRPIGPGTYRLKSVMTEREDVPNAVGMFWTGATENDAPLMTEGGTITIAAIDVAHAEGHYDAIFPNGERLRGSFKGDYCPAL